MPGVMHVIDHSTAKVRPLRQKIVNGVLSVDGSASTQPISAASLPLPSGAASAANQASGNAHLNTIQACVASNKLAISVADTLVVNGSGVTQPISAASLPLPSGAASSAHQATGNGHLNVLQGCVSSNKMAVSISDTVTVSQGASKNQVSLNAGSSVSAGDFSSAHNVTNYNKAIVVGTHTGSDNIEVHISEDDVTYYKFAGLSGGYPDSDAAFSFAFDCPFKYYKLKYKGSGTVTALGFAQA